MNRRPTPAADLTRSALWLTLLLATIAAGPATTPTATPVPTPQTIRDERFHFTLRLPDGYVAVPPQPNVLYGFAKPDPDGGMPLGILNVQRMNGTIGRDRPILPPGQLPGARLVPASWKGEPVWVYAMTNTIAGTPYTLRGVQLPVRGEAIQIFYAVPTSLAGHIDQELDGLLAGFDAPLGWTTPAGGGPAAAADVNGWADYRVVIAGGLWAALAFGAVRGAGNARRAFRAGLVAAACAAVLIGLALAVALTSGRFPPLTGASAPRRVRLLVVSTAQLSGWAGLLVAGVRRITLRFGPGRRAVPPPLPTVGVNDRPA